jgi:hypothetical protein
VHNKDSKNVNGFEEYVPGVLDFNIESVTIRKSEKKLKPMMIEVNERS